MIVRRTVAAIAATALAIVSLSVVGVMPASATNAQGPNNGTTGGHLFGAYSVTTTTGSQVLGVCITPTLASPDQIPSDTYTVEVGAATGGVGITQGEAATLSYLGALYSYSGWHGYSGPTVAAGIAQLLYLSHGGQTVSGGNQSSSGALSNYATTYPGPWSITVTAGPRPYTSAKTHTGVLTLHDSHATGGTVPGVPVRLTSASAGSSIVMEANTTNSSGQIPFRWSYPTGGSFSFTFGIGSTPAGSPNELVPPSGSNGQSLMDFGAVPIEK